MVYTHWGKKKVSLFGPSFFFSILIFLSVLISFSSIEAAFRELNLTAIRVIKNRQLFFSQLATPRSGEFVLPDSVREMLETIRAEKIQFYRVSNGIAKDPWVFQQINATAWPSQMSSQSPFIFFASNEKLPENCTLQRQGKEVVFAHCQ